MAILTVCAEDCDLVSTAGNVTYTNNSTYFRSGYARGALSVNGSSTADPPGIRFRVLDFSSASSEFWLTGRVYYGSATIIDGIQLIRFLDGSGVARLVIRTVSASNQLKISTRTGAGSFSDLATSTTYIAPNGSQKLDIYVKYAGDGTGQVTCYANGVSFLTYTGANTTDGATTLAGVEFSSFATSAVNPSYWSEVVAATTDTRAMGLVTLTTSTAGNAQQWTGTASNVNQNTITNDAQFVYSATANQIEQFKPGALPAGNWTVDAVVMAARALRGSQGPQNLQFVTRIGSTDYTSASQQPSTSFGNLRSIQETNPGTSTAWITSDLADTNLQYGVKSIT